MVSEVVESGSDGQGHFVGEWMDEFRKCASVLTRASQSTLSRLCALLILSHSLQPGETLYHCSHCTEGPTITDALVLGYGGAGLRYQAESPCLLTGTPCERSYT